jgi:TonB family protein
MTPDLGWNRLYAALAVSCLLHGAVVLAPYLGASTTVSRYAVKGVQKPGAARTFTVRLLAGRGAASKFADADAAGGGRANEEPRPALERALGIDLLPIPAPTYYTTDQLTKGPRPTSAPRLNVPELGAMFASGKVILKVWINDLGNVVSVDVEKSEVPEAVSATAAAAFGKLRFLPGELNGRPVGAMMRIEVTYEDGGSQSQ